MSYINTAIESSMDDVSGIGIHDPVEGNDDHVGEQSPKKADISKRSTHSVWFEKIFGPLGKYGKLKKDQFVAGAKKVEGFAENLFAIFDFDENGRVSLQELGGGLLLLWQRHGKKKNNKICQWFTDYFEKICGADADIELSDFKAALDDTTFSQKLFELLDSDQDGEIDLKDLLSGLDRLECASTDSKWYQWIEEQFNVSIAHDRKIDFEQFRKALHLGKTFFAERFFTLFDDNGDGKIDMTELVAGLELLTKGSQMDKLTFLFRVYDLDGNLSVHFCYEKCDNENLHYAKKDETCLLSAKGF